MREFEPASIYVRMLKNWLCAGRWYVAIGVVLFATITWSIIPAIPLLETCKERDARWLGWLLQIVGFFIIAWGYVSDARKNGRLTPKRWLKQFPSPFAARVASGSMNASEDGSDTFSAGGFVTQSVTAFSTIEERLTALEANTKTYFDAIQVQIIEIKSKQSNLAGEFSELNSNMKVSTHSLSEKIDDSVSGKVQLNLFAVALFLVGITVATLSPEIASFVGETMSCSKSLFD